ncbi:Alpha/Beta hydrolase protein [Chaetomium fimeti]|uniref:Alpha/Beta hydrolase protein n=1 Tax=Chaetomium fimeti TaxID=1854472 RepID=A0AAE0HC32_9PEZI|nr:Alpha/Beta hydrolase protein [Chaetomium fimeti]
MASPAEWSFTPLPAFAPTVFPNIAEWSFTPLPAFAPTVFPNIALWDVSNAVKNLTYQVQISWPFEWESREVTDKSALTMYVLDGNALGMTASEAIKRRKFIYPNQPDSVVVSVGYPLSDAVYDVARRTADYLPPLPDNEGRADDFLAFLGDVLQPWVRGEVFPGVAHARDALFGHSLGGLFVAYAFVQEPALFDTFVAASPAVAWNKASVLEDITRRFGDGISGGSEEAGGGGGGDGTKPAMFIGYGSGEQFPVRGRTETEVQFQARKALWDWTRITEASYEFYDRVRAGTGTREVVLREYVGQEHSGVAGSVLTDGINYFFDW